MLKVQRARRRFLNYLVLTLAGAILAIPAHADDITGKPRVIDGDTIEIAGERIRLHGIDAPESKQKCTAGGKEWSCGQEASLSSIYRRG